MSAESFEAFLTALVKNPDLQVRLKEATSGAEGTAIFRIVSEFASQNGYVFTPAEAEEGRGFVVSIAQGDRELSEAELESIAAGAWTTLIPSLYDACQAKDDPDGPGPPGPVPGVSPDTWARIGSLFKSW